jgi:hypothetical protein
LGLKHKLRPENADFKALDFDAILSVSTEELHQVLIGLYGDYLLPATMHDLEKVLRGPDTIKALNKNKEQTYIVSKKMLRDQPVTDGPAQLGPHILLKE